MGISKDQKKELQLLEGQGLKRYMVGLLLESVECKTIYAKNPEDAVKLVTEKKQGTAAGFEGPRVLGVMSKEIGLNSKTKDMKFLASWDKLRKEMAEKAMKDSAHVQVPSLIIKP